MNLFHLMAVSPFSDTSRMIKWKLKGTEVSLLFGASDDEEVFVHPVKYTGKVWAMKGSRAPKIYSWAGFESAEVKFEKKRFDDFQGKFHLIAIIYFINFRISNDDKIVLLLYFIFYVT